MDNVLRVLVEAVETLEEYLPDAAEAIESSAERKKVVALVNRVSKLIRETKQEL